MFGEDERKCFARGSSGKDLFEAEDGTFLHF
jgi:hypothetical protein